MADVFYPSEATSILEIKDDNASSFVRAVESIDGNRENLISYYSEDKSWHIEATNDCRSVNIGESVGLLSVEGKTFEEAVEKFLHAVKLYNALK